MMLSEKSLDNVKSPDNVKLHLQRALHKNECSWCGMRRGRGMRFDFLRSPMMYSFGSSNGSRLEQYPHKFSTSLISPTAISNQKHRVGRSSAAIKRYRLHTHTECPFHGCQSCSFYKSIGAKITPFFIILYGVYHKIDQNLYTYKYIQFIYWMLDK